MGINLGALSTISTTKNSSGVVSSQKVSDMVSTDAVKEVRSTDGQGITLNLSKGVSLDLKKQMPTLCRCLIGLGWDPVNGKTADLDVAAVCLSHGKLLSAEDVIFFNNLSRNGVKLDKDNRTGEGDGDDEKMHIDFSKVPNNIDSIAIFVTIYEPDNINFGMINNSYIRLVDEDEQKADGSGGEKLIYILNDEGGLYRALHFANLVRNDNGWSFETIGEGVSGDLNQIINRYC